MARLVAKGVSKTYGATKALRRGDLEVEAGEVHVLIGSNGSGKSTLCKIVAGSVRPDTGQLLLEGHPMVISGPEAARKLGIGIFYQELSLAPHRSVAENILLSDLPGGLFVNRKLLNAKAQHYIDLFQGVTGENFHAGATVETLRPDQRQLVEIMKALCSEAPILIFDEPTSALDRAQVDRFFDILRRLKNDGRSIVFISHRMDEIFALGDRVTVIPDGETVATKRIADTDAAEVIRLMVGGEQTLVASEPHRTTTHAAAVKTVLAVQGLSGAGFRDVSFEVAAGEILGLGGLHGQGQSSVLRALFGATPPTGGGVQLNGERLNPSSPRSTIARGLAYVSGDRRRDGVIAGRPILENVTPVHALKQRLWLATPSALREKALPALEALHTKFAGFSHPISSLSGGNQQKIVIARWLIDRPDVLLLDDPTKGIDLSAKADLFQLIRKLAAEGMAIILYSSEDAELLGNADRILVFNGGSVTRELTGDQRTPFNLYKAAYGSAAHEAA